MERTPKLEKRLSRDVVFEVRRCRCDSWYCEGCAKSKGVKLRQELVKAMTDWTACMMLTLTVDPEIFPEGPEAAYRWVRGKRGTGELVRSLYRWGYLRSRRYFYVLEFQKNGWPHWHVLVESDYIPHEALCKAWNKAAPPSMGKNARAGLGAVKFSKGDFQSMKHAALYATKYLIKTPKEGWPAWVLDFDGTVRRYDHSKKLLKTDDAAAAIEEELQEPEAETVEGTQNEKVNVSSLKLSRRRRPMRRLRERLAECGKDARLFAVREVIAGVSVIGRHWHYIGPLDEAFDELRTECGYENSDAPSFVVPREWAEERIRDMSPQEAFGGMRHRHRGKLFIAEAANGVTVRAGYNQAVLRKP